MIKRVKKNYPKYKFIITGNALYAVETIIEICEKNKWNYIFNLKPDRLKEINSTFEEIYNSTMKLSINTIIFLLISIIEITYLVRLNI